MRFVSATVAGVIGLAAIIMMAGCTQPMSAPATPLAQVCPPGVPWVPDGYFNGKFVPGHCQGQAAQ